MRKIVVLLSCILLSGCQPPKVGPRNLRSDSISYNRAMQSSIDSQLLLNIVRLRYRDTPAFLQIGLISSSYENKCSLASDFRLDALNRETTTIGITPKIGFDRTEKPTTTYQPVRGEGFVKEFLSPISLQSLVLVNSSGWKVDRIIKCCAQRINHLRNATTASGPTPKDAPDYSQFHELAEAFAHLEKQDAVDIVKAKDPETGKAEVYLVFDRDRADPALMSYVWDLLDIQPGLYRFRLIASHGKEHKPDEVNIDLRSPLSMLYFLSHGVHVPEWDKMTGKVTQTVDSEGYLFDWNEVMEGILTVHSGPPCGRSPAASVYYRGTVFFIDDSDLDSKSTFSLLTQILALQLSCPELIPTTFTIPLTSP